MEGSSGEPPSSYRLDQLGWLAFERLASLVLAAEAGPPVVHWHRRTASGRVAWVEESIALANSGFRLPGPVAVAVTFVGGVYSRMGHLPEFLERMRGLAGDLQLGPADCLLIVTNLDAGEVRRAISSEALAAPERVVVLGGGELSQSLDRHAALRCAMPSVLGLCDLDALIPRELAARSTLDVERAQVLARVFEPTRAYERARAVLARHRFVVLTGPPEMGKTAIAHMIALAQLTDGWEAHDCISPEQVWGAFDRGRSQVFVADDAFGSTEYRADAAEHWARELGRMLGELDERHWLIWTSRPAPLRAGLRRVQRERGAARFPAPGEVLVDASDLDLAEKTMILFRHVKDHGVSGAARDVVRAAGVTIVEHPHFTPERIRRFVNGGLDELVRDARDHHWRPDPRSGSAAGRRQRAAVLRAIERELATPTREMATSFRSLDEEHRALLIALLDTPSGLTDERELAATVRRHHPSGLSRAPRELIDRLTDHFLRLSSLGIDWVHPSWRDLVIDELRTDHDLRQRFLRACGPYGALLVLSLKGGVTGERALPLLVDDADWDAFTDRVGELLRDLEAPDMARLLLACHETLGADLDAPRRAEARSFAEYVLGASRRSWDNHRQALPVFLLAAWFEANSSLPKSLDPPRIDATWVELHPSSLARAVDYLELQRIDDWLALAHVLATHDPPSLQALGFPQRDHATLLRVSEILTELMNKCDRDLRPLVEQVLRRLQGVAPAYAAWSDIEQVPSKSNPTPADRWWVPEDIAAPPTTEPVTPTPPLFTRAEVDRVLSDL